NEPRPPRYLKPMNKMMMAVQRLGIPTGPAMVLTVPGRKSGRPRSTPMTPFKFRGGLYAVAGYPGADWAANARAAGAGILSRGQVAVVRADAAHRGLDVGGGDDLQVFDRHRLARAFLGDDSGVAESFGALDDVAGEAAVLHGVDAVLSTGRGVVADGGGRL